MKMKKTEQLARIGVLFLILVFIVSCATTGKKSIEKQTILDMGISAWNRQGPDAAIHYWSQLKDNQQRETYIGYVDQYKKATKDLDDIVSSPPTKESQYLSAYNTLHKTYASLPATLEIPKPTAKKMSVMASGRTRALLDKYEIEYILIDAKMKQQLWDNKETALLFLMSNSNEFEKVYDKNSIEIWEYS